MKLFLVGSLIFGFLFHEVHHFILNDGPSSVIGSSILRMCFALFMLCLMILYGYSEDRFMRTIKRIQTVAFTPMRRFTVERVQTVTLTPIKRFNIEETRVGDEKIV